MGEGGVRESGIVSGVSERGDGMGVLLGESSGEEVSTSEEVVG